MGGSKSIYFFSRDRQATPLMVAVQSHESCCKRNEERTTSAGRAGAQPQRHTVPRSLCRCPRPGTQFDVGQRPPPMPVRSARPRGRRSQHCTYIQMWPQIAVAAVAAAVRYGTRVPSRRAESRCHNGRWGYLSILVLLAGCFFPYIHMYGRRRDLLRNSHRDVALGVTLPLRLPHTANQDVVSFGGTTQACTLRSESSETSCMHGATRVTATYSYVRKQQGMYIHSKRVSRLHQCSPMER